jgi:DNA-binding HxlR family transcriptional regulator
MTGTLEPRAGWGPPDRCPMAATLEVVGTKSAFLLLREAFYGATRFDEFVERTAISEPVAAARLKELCEHGLLDKVPYQEPGQRTRHGYALTPKGADLLPTLVSLMEWGDRHGIPGGARVELRHAGCGERVGVALTCAGGHEVAGDAVELGLKRRGGA